MTSTDSTTVQPRLAPPTARPPRPRMTRWIVGGAALALLGLTLGLTGVGPSRGSSGGPRPGGSVMGEELEDGFVADDEIDGDIDGGGGGEDLGGGVDLGGGSPEPEVEPESEVEPDVEPEPEVEQPEPPVFPIPATLVVTPDPIHLKTGAYSGSITIANGGDQFMDWEATTKPWVSLSDTNGQLGARAENVVTFTIDASDLPSGSFAFKIKVTGNGGTTYVDVDGAKPFDEITI